ncbi:MAG: cation diffusion facilitator family transporter [Christensenellaceae bacterium]|jgi:cation diffusion facilitator family transporter|nr:cation diffusion facilitator family transporter [Christensenellaceae bacterium]
MTTINPGPIQGSKRSVRGTLIALTGIIANLALTTLKLIAGILAHSVTLIADAINNLTDASSSVVVMVGFRLSNRPADHKHPYGHARYEYISAFLTAIFIIIAATVLGKSSIDRIIEPHYIYTVNALTYIALAVSLCVKLFLAIFYHLASKRLNSLAIKSAGVDSRNDIIITLFALLSALIFTNTGVNADGAFGLLISAFILISGIKLFFDALSPLIGHADNDTISQLKNKILCYPNILGVHDIMVHNYGVTKKYAVAHVEVLSKTDIYECHKLIDKIERDILIETGINISIHVDPCEISDPLFVKTKISATQALTSCDSRITIHDFRMDKTETGYDLFFDVLLPYDMNMEKEQIISIVKTALDSDTNFAFFINIDRN